MPKEYAEDKIRQALRMHGNNISRARQQVMSWSYEDFELLRALSRPHLDGIIAYQVERVASGRAEIEKRHPKAPKQNKGEAFGVDLLRAVAASGASVFGQEDGVGIVNRRTGASKQHIDAIHKMASSRKTIVKKNPYKKS